MISATSFIAYVAALAVASAVPGPGVAALIGQSLGGRFRSSLFFIGGMALGDVVFLSCAVAGLAALVQLFEQAMLAIKLLAGAYLLRLAWKFWSQRGSISEPDGAGSRSGGRAFAAGLMVALGNPKVIVFYLALLPAVLDLGHVGPAQWAALSALTVATLFATLTPYALLALRARGAISSSGTLARLNRAAAAIIGGAGVLIIGQAAAAMARRS
ncbi:LysE family translocator [Mangrovicoccus sp. HB161399]|uniref:LysE family translocator n=1 Tax=Mangrovicoccus sp. HB161399 TaxID=2720392 RepID=UPI001552D107|nr:LysE family translocator [Mangrovicoccus sp. HB161399]